VNVYEKLPLGGMSGEGICPPCTACVSLSRFVQVTVSPTLTVRSAGWNANPWIVTAELAAALLAAVQSPSASTDAMASPSQRLSAGNLSSWMS
jgi:hypothetical protein